MIYFDNSATSYPKPLSVIKAVNDSLRFYSANPGRSGHKLSMKAAEKVYECRLAVCKLFNVDDESKVVFTSGCTQSLNIVIKGLLKKGDHCVISCLEHNSVLRPLEKLKSLGVTYSVADVDINDDEVTLANFKKCIQSNTKLFICTHASNVFGIRLPIAKICKLAHDNNILFCVDAAQSAGVIDINVSKDKYDYVCCAGHKGLYGPMGVGFLIVNSDVLPDTIIEGGTGSDSLNAFQPEFIPDRFESGTLNIPGICGLKSGIDFVQARGVENIYNHEIKFIKRISKALSKNTKIILYNDFNNENIAPVMSFSINGIDSEKVSRVLSSRYNIATRAGLHCAPLAHKYMRTHESGTIRISPSVFTSENDVAKLIKSINYFNFY